MAEVGVAVVGFGWMGRVHTQAYLRLPHHFPRLTSGPELVAVADDVPGRAADAAARYGFATATSDWRQVVADPRVRAVSITAPNFLRSVTEGTAYGATLDDAVCGAAALEAMAASAEEGTWVSFE